MCPYLVTNNGDDVPQLIEEKVKNEFELEVDYEGEPQSAFKELKASRRNVSELEEKLQDYKVKYELQKNQYYDIATLNGQLEEAIILDECRPY